MEKEKISNGEIGALGIEDLDLLVAFSRVANGLLKHQVMDKASILTNLEALIADPTPTGNHFVEWGELSVEDNALGGIPGGTYLALLSHSGSRGFGGNIADIYSKIAMEKTRLPNEAKHLALPGIWRPIALR